MAMEQHETISSPEHVIVHEWERVVMPHVARRKHDAAEFFLDQTLAAYEEEGRHYHDLTHIADCIVKLKPYQDRHDYLQLFLALLWHDVVYDTASKTNEKDSAFEAVEMMDFLKLPGPDTVSRLIVATASHHAETEDEALICAIDLSILGSDANTYDRYQAGIYQEYAWVEHNAFHQGRAKVLQNLIGDGTIFVHPDFVHLNEPAVANMQRELSRLTA